MVSVAVQGREASFHAVAAREYFGADVRLVYCATFGEVFERLQECDFGVVAVENSISGAVHEVGRPDVAVRQLVTSSNANVTDSITLPIEQCLIALPGAQLKDITAVYSHDAALKQCSTFLRAELPQAKQVEHEDTAGAVADIKRWDDPRRAAIASQGAAELHGMRVLVSNIGDNKNSVTKFLIVSAAPVHTGAPGAPRVLERQH